MTNTSASEVLENDDDFISVSSAVSIHQRPSGFQGDTLVLG
jgi:hypothetical protein